MFNFLALVNNSAMCNLVDMICKTCTSALNKWVGRLRKLRCSYQWWSRGHKAWGQGQPSEDRTSRGQEPRTQAQVFSKKKVLQKFFSGDLQRTKVVKEIFQAISRRRYLQIFRKVSGVFQQNFNDSKNGAVFEPRTGQFSRTWSFVSKDVTFEAKDFKICPWECPQGQGRPWGLHLW